MADSPLIDPQPTTRLDRLVQAYSHAPYSAPFFTFLVLMALGNQFGPEYLHYTYAVRIFGSLAVALVFWKYYPPLGKVHWVPAIVVGLLVAWGWVEGHHWFTAQGWYHQPFADAKPADYYDPRKYVGEGIGLWWFLLIRIGGAATVVPIVEEVFWRAFILRALIDWDDFESVPLAKFTLFSFIACSLMSALEHPQWGVGILCWMVYNLLWYWKRSLLCLMVTHGITNLALYIYVFVYEDWVFWS
ncbi:MAG: CAAX prenyl protease-related protein [bacterium]|nr:CAAX prenyl protease-related protein [bacterium]